jgi:hypothetical protein
MDKKTVQALKYILGYVEAHNKFDEDIYAAEAAHYLQEYLDSLPTQ